MRSKRVHAHVWGYLGIGAKGPVHQRCVCGAHRNVPFMSGVRRR